MRPSPLPASGPAPSAGGIGKVACAQNFHCVMARDYEVFYKVLRSITKLK